MNMQLSAPQPLAATHLLDGFNCGEPSLNDWLKRRALTNHLNGASRTFVVVDADCYVFGYYALAPVASRIKRPRAPSGATCPIRYR
jgi:hypothetical protein